jgi:PHD/YefM family antitoxin component YafN of YafNO toxin-antitoxin module
VTIFSKIPLKLSVLCYNKDILFLEISMPAIRQYEDLRNNYNEISELCHKYSEPVFITRDGTGDLVVMSTETYELLSGKYELFNSINEGLDQIKNGKLKPMREAIKTIREEVNQ